MTCQSGPKKSNNTYSKSSCVWRITSILPTVMIDYNDIQRYMRLENNERHLLQHFYNHSTLLKSLAKNLVQVRAL